MGSQPATPQPQIPAPLPPPSLGAPPATPLLPPQPSLEQLKKQAKALLVAVRGGDRAALNRFERYFPPLPPGPSPESAAPPPTLARAQLVVAREHGFPSWTRLRREVTLALLRRQLERFAERGWPPKGAAMQALNAAGPDGRQVALEGLSHPDPRVRRGAAGFLDHHATDACVPQLLELALHDPSPDVRRSALHTLACEDCKETPLQLDALPLLVRAFREDPNRRVRYTVALALRRQADLAPVQEAFRAAAREDPSGLVRRVALNHLRGDDALSEVEHAARHDPDPLVRGGAAIRLSREPGDHQLACRVLEQVLREDVTSKVRREAHLTLKRLSPEYRQLAAQRAREASLARARDTRSA